MKPEYIPLALHHNEEDKKFELSVQKLLVFIEYEISDKNQFTLVHTEADPKLAGTGAAQALTEKVFEYIDQNHFSIIPECPYLLSFIKKHPEWKKIVDKNCPQYQELN